MKSFGLTLAMIIVTALLHGCATHGEWTRLSIDCMEPSDVQIELERKIRVGCYKDLDRYYCPNGPTIPTKFAGVWFIDCTWRTK